MLLLHRWQRQQMWLCCALCFRQPKMTRYHRFTDPLCADVCILVCRGLQQARLSSLEGCTVSNRGQRPRIAATHSVSAWRAVRPRRWRREPPRRRRTLSYRWSRRHAPLPRKGGCLSFKAARAASSPQNIFHTQRPFSVLTLLAFGDEKYYICTEIWEEPRLPPFFVTFPLKTGVLGAHPGKICLPLILICLLLILIRGRQRKIMRRVGKIGRRKVFR